MNEYEAHARPQVTASRPEEQTPPEDVLPDQSVSTERRARDANATIARNRIKPSIPSRLGQSGPDQSWLSKSLTYQSWRGGQLPRKPDRETLEGQSPSAGEGPPMPGPARTATPSATGVESEDLSIRNKIHDGVIPSHKTLLGSPGTPGSFERLDPEYKVRQRKFFAIGRVFAILWAEPMGTNGSSVSGDSITRFGEMVYSKIRRFVVVRAGETSCSCLPILTYSGQGVSSRHAIKAEHTIVYAARSPPDSLPSEQPQDGEAGLQSEAIRIDLDHRGLGLDPMSRINYGKVYTIEHDLKVKPLGMVNHRSLSAFVNQFRAVWVTKIGLMNPPRTLAQAGTIQSKRIEPASLSPRETGEAKAGGSHKSGKATDNGKATSTMTTQKDITPPLNEASHAELLQELLRRQPAVDLMNTLAANLAPSEMSDFCRRWSSTARPTAVPAPSNSSSAPPSAMRHDGASWTWSPSLKLYYYYSRSTDEFVYSDGTRSPRNIPLELVPITAYDGPPNHGGSAR